MRLQEAIAHYGTKMELAKRLNISRGAISQWGENIPKLRQYEIERDTQGRLKVDHGIDRPEAEQGSQSGNEITRTA